MEQPGILALIPTLVVIVLAVWSRRSLEPLIAGVVVGYAMIATSDVMTKTLDSAQSVLADGVMIPLSTWASPRRWRSPSFSSVFQKVLSFGHMFDDAMEGVKGMLPAIAIIIVSFMLKDVNDTLKLTDFLIGTVSPWMTAAFLPMICFGALALIAFATGSFRGTYAIALPIVLPLGEQLGVDPALTISAVVSAGAFGAHASFFGDSTVLPATATDVEPMDHAITQLPYILIAAAVALVGLAFL